MSEFSFDSISDAIEDIRLGKIIIVLDDEERENEGDFIMAADKVTPEAVNFMATIGRGLICTPVDSQTAQKLNLKPMVESNTSEHETAFTITIDAKQGISTGISAADRYHTIKIMTLDNTDPSDFVRPGHIFPLLAKDGGVLQRPGHTEAAVDMAKLAGLHPSGIICEIMNQDGSMSRTEELIILAKKYQLKIITIKDLISYRLNLNLAPSQKLDTVKLQNSQHSAN